MIRSPVLILGCPRSGTTLLFNILSEVPSLWSIGYESKAIIERYHHPSVKDWISGALDATDLTPVSREYMLAAFERESAPGTFWRRVNGLRGRLRNSPIWAGIKRHGRTEATGSRTSSALPQQALDLVRVYVRLRNRGRGLASSLGLDGLVPSLASGPIRLLEKTPENCLRLPFLMALFPDARILYLIRDGRSNVNSLLEGWKQPHLFPGYRVPARLQIPGYARERWAFSLIPGWQELCSSPLEDICAWQWIRCNEAILAHFEETKGLIPALTLRYEDLVGLTQGSDGSEGVLRSVADFLEIDYERDLAYTSGNLPRINVVSAPEASKWRRENAAAIRRIGPLIEPMMQRLGYDSNDP